MATWCHGKSRVLESCVQAPVPAPSPRVTLGKSLNTIFCFLSGQLFCQPYWAPSLFKALELYERMRWPWEPRLEGGADPILSTFVQTGRFPVLCLKCSGDMQVNTLPCTLPQDVEGVWRKHKRANSDWVAVVAAGMLHKGSCYVRVHVT